MVQLLLLYTNPESHNAQRHRQTDRQTDDMMMPITHYSADRLKISKITVEESASYSEIGYGSCQAVLVPRQYRQRYWRVDTQAGRVVGTVEYHSLLRVHVRLWL